MPRLRFTDTSIRALPPAVTGTIWYSDTDMQGLQLAVGSRTRSFYISKSLRNKTIRKKIGEWPAVPTNRARKDALGIAAAISRGEDPRYSQTDADDAERNIVGRVLDSYIQTFSGNRKRNRLSAKTAKEYRDAFRLHARRWLTRDIRTITDRDLRKLHEGMEKHAPTANKFARLFRTLQRHAGITPTPHFPYYDERRRPNAITPERRHDFGSAMRAIECPSKRAVWQIACYTGIRRSNLLNLTWRDVDLKARTVHLERMKNKESRTMPLSRQAVAVLKGLVGLHPTWVFPSSAGSKSGRLIEVRDDLIDSPITFHDTRRLFSETAAECLTPEYIIAYLRGDVVNESMAQRYMTRLDVEAMRVPIQAIGDRVESQLFGGKSRKKAPSKIQQKSNK